MFSVHITRQRFVGSVVVILWVCLVADVYTILPKRAWGIRHELKKSGDEKLLELWGGFHAASREIRKHGMLGTTVGIPSFEYSETRGLRYAYGHGNHNALMYPGRAIQVVDRTVLEQARPEFILLDGTWPEFTFPGDPRNPNARFVTQPQIVKVNYDRPTA